MKNRKLDVLAILCIVLSQFTFAQDSLYTTDGKATAVKITEVNNDNIKYKKLSNIDGPTYTIDKTSVAHIKYKNGEDEVYQKQEAFASPKAKIFTGDITAKGRRVYLNISDDEMVGLKNELKNELVSWDYWQIVHDKTEADFILEVTTVKKAMNVLTNTEVKSKAFIKGLDGTILWESKEYSSYASLYNGYNALHASIKKLVKDGLKKKYS